MGERHATRQSIRTLGSAAILALLGVVPFAAQRENAQLAGYAVPANLGDHEYFTGQPWTGEPGITVTVDEIMARATRQPNASDRAVRVIRPNGVKVDERAGNPASPDSPNVALWPSTLEPLVHRSPVPSNPQAVSTNFLAVQLSESGDWRPNTNGAVGPTQVMIVTENRFKVFDKSGNLQGLNISADDFFWAIQGGSVGAQHPHVRFDRLTQRWYITANEFRLPSNGILIAVSSGPTITGFTSFTFFRFQHDLVGPTPNIDTGQVANDATLGVDQNALYLGVNEFDTTNPLQYRSSTGYVVNKANLLAGFLTVTAFRGLAIGRGVFSFVPGPFAPQGVDNDDAAATEGYFIGVDNRLFGLLEMRRVTNPGGTPSISGSIAVPVPPTTFPVNQVQPGSVNPLDAIDDRLSAAMIKKNKMTGVSSLWTAHNIAVNILGQASPVWGKNGARWYQIDNLTGGPMLTQAGTLFDASPINTRGFWIPSVAANGQGHMALGCSMAGPADFAGVAVAGRLSSDPIGTTEPFTSVIAGQGVFNDSGNGTMPWGHYSRVAVDPNDDMTMWTFQEYALPANSLDDPQWGVRAVKLLAPPPAALASASPSSVAAGRPSVNVTITGTSSAGSGFFDPGAGFANHLAAGIIGGGEWGGGVAVNSVTFVDPTHVMLNISTVGATVGAKTVAITNPDGQQASGTILTIVPAPTVSSITPNSGPINGETAVTIAGTNFVTGATVTLGGIPPRDIVVRSSTTITAITGPHPAGTVDVVVTNPSLVSGTLVDAYTYVPPPTVSSITPDFGPPSGGIAVTIGGLGFFTGATVTIGDVMATNVIVMNSMTITATVAPEPHLEGTFDVVVTNPDGQGGGLANGFTYRLVRRVLGDLNADGRFDLLWRHKDKGINLGWLMDALTVGNSGFLPTVTDVNWQIVGRGDFDGDGKADVLLRDQMTGQNIVWLMDGLTIKNFAFLPTIPPSWEVRGVGDFDGDGKADVVLRDKGTGQYLGWLMNGLTIANSALLPRLSRNWDIRGVGDFDGDGRADIILRDSAEGQYAAWLMNGLMIADAAFLPTLKDLNWDIRGVGDFDGDGKADVILRHARAGQNLVWLMNGVTIANSGFLPTVADLNWEIKAIGDLNGDGRADVVWRHKATGQNIGWLMNTNGLVVANYAFLPTISANFEIVPQ